ncbi:MAG: hypothetical protein K8T25_15900 [Planctomycetia bacterium]|nr:hypothetical protein [Planctomycetia bacterium]
MAPCAGRLIGWALCLLSLAGCSQDEITQYRAPKDPPLPQWAAERGPRQRMLAAIISYGEKTWFFKFIGPDELVTREAPAFERFVRSIRFTEKADRPVTWETPPGWTDLGPSGERVATLRVTADGQKAELTVTALGPEANSVLANVIRWRRQLGLMDPIGENQLGQFVAQFSTSAGPVVMVDLTSAAMVARGPAESPAGPAESHPRGPTGPRVSGPAAVAPAATEHVEYQLPPGWVAKPGLSRFAVAGFVVGPERDGITVTVTPLAGAAGGLEANVNRWRGQVGLEPADLKELVKTDARKLQIDNRPGILIRVVGAKSADAEQRAILGAMTIHSGTSWFIKMTGPADAVLKLEEPFARFAESVRFKSAADKEPVEDVKEE